MSLNYASNHYGTLGLLTGVRLFYRQPSSQVNFHSKVDSARRRAIYFSSTTNAANSLCRCGGMRTLNRAFLPL